MNEERSLRRLEERFSSVAVISTMIAFGDFYWERDWSIGEMTALEPAVCLDAKGASRRAVMQHVRGEIRYWLTTERDPHRDGDSTEHELGAVSSLADAIALCREFLVAKRSVTQLQTMRRASTP